VEDHEIYQLFEPLNSDITDEDKYSVEQPLLAHYTSIEVLEKILSNNEMWLSNPLFMNDLDEVRFGIVNGVQVFESSEPIRAAFGTVDRYTLFRDALTARFHEFDVNGSFDTYIFCMSKHDRNDPDGLLSMWRGYGGDGGGVALVFDSAKFGETTESPLMLARVRYGSNDERITWMHNTANLFAKIFTDGNVPNAKIHLAVHHLFDRLKRFSLFTKHQGFSEEREWRLVYDKERDHKGWLLDSRNYFMGPRGLEPKLKLQIAPIEGVTTPDISLEKILDCILLGPRVSDPLSYNSICRMFDVLGKSELRQRIVQSSIPYRQT
jgi:hypothetical protein